MDCVLKQEVQELINKSIAELKAVDDFMTAYYHETPGYQINPSTVFMSAWNKVKTAKAALHSINLDEVTT